MSCSTCPSTSCTCCHVHNVTIDNALIVSGSTTLTTGTPCGSALTVTTCANQVSGELVSITGTADATAFAVKAGDSSFQGKVTIQELILNESTPAPLSTDTGQTGEIRWATDSGTTYLYLYAGGSWNRVALSTW